jgi:hypothetical protein
MRPPFRTVLPAAFAIALGSGLLAQQTAPAAVLVRDRLRVHQGRGDRRR